VIVHLNGQLVKREQARIDPFARGFLFGDGVYEGLRAFGGRIVGLGLHVERLRRGLAETQISWEAGNLGTLTDELTKANGLTDAFIYWQITRGVPGPGQPVRTRVLTGAVKPTVFGFCVPAAGLDSFPPVPEKTAISAPDTRWLRGQLKSISLLGNVLGALEADRSGADDAILIRDGLAAEGTSANLIVALGRSGRTEVVTPPLNGVPILRGVTRDILLAAAPDMVERPVRAEELREAAEVMLTGTLTMITSIVKLDGRAVGDGKAGPAATRLLGRLVEVIRARECGA
jgi:D-alanine transaminase